MCGIAGIARADGRTVGIEQLGRMAAALRHRGPDGYGYYLDGGVGFAHVRLAILDRAGSAQPMVSGDGRVVVTYNGEIYNYRELRRDLAAHGHQFHTRGDTEVLLHAWRAWGESLLPRLEGQFAFALHDTVTGHLLLARDRLGIRPLYFTVSPRGTLVFGSEAKAVFASAELEARVDPAGVDELVTFWTSCAPRTPFLDVAQLPPASLLRWEHGAWSVSRWYARARASTPAQPLDTLGTLLRTAVRDRLHADVPVGAFLSGGLDSTIVTALAREASAGPLHTFSVAFDQEALDERRHQEAVAHALGTTHHALAVSADDVAAALPDVVRHVESPLVRTAPVPLYLLAAHARDHGIRVVLSGEGADELFLGYDLFKEVKLRLFCLRHPASQLRPRLLERLYPYQGHGIERRGPFWRAVFLEAGSVTDPLFSHQPRMRAAARVRDFYAEDWRQRADAAQVVEELRRALPPGFAAWSPLDRAAWLEEELLLSNLLLSAQGDRVTLAHGVEGRYPFLDRALAEFARGLPDLWRLPGLREKYVLHAWAARALPPALPRRPKQPYRAPGLGSVVASGRSPAWLQDALSPECTREIGIFREEAVNGLSRRAMRGAVVSPREEQALVTIATTHLWHRQFIRARWHELAPLPPDAADVLHRPPHRAVA